MARTGAEERRATRRKVLTRGLLAGVVALGLPAAVNALIARRASRLGERATAQEAHWTKTTWLSEFGPVVVRSRLTGPAKGRAEPEKAPVLFLHSLGPGHSSRQWLDASTRLTERRSVHLLDDLGWGDSGRPKRRYGFEFSVDLLRSFVRSQLTQPCHLVAAGESAPAALALGALESERVLSVALSGPAGLQLCEPHQTPWSRLLYGLLGTPIFGTSALNAYIRREAIESSLRRHLMPDTELSEDAIETHYRLAHLPDSDHALTAYLQGRYERRLKVMKLPAETPLWIGWGRHAMGEPVADADLWLRQFPGAQLTVFEQAASWPHVDQPSQLANELERFLRTRP